MGADSFFLRIPAKWILMGEHAVLRGAHALALPHPDFFLSFRFEPENSSSEGLIVEPLEAQNIVLQLVNTALQLLGVDSARKSELNGRIRIQSSIPLGAGLGSSAALCVAISRWVRQFLNLKMESEFSLARRLENEFHGESSGMDIAAVAAGEAIRFSREEGALPLGFRRLPHFTFHDTGLRERTRTCVEQVDRLFHKNPEFAKQVDQKMAEASALAEEALREFNEGNQSLAVKKLARAMTQGQECFKEWGLLPAPVNALSQMLLKQGALAVKLTGAGQGGFLVALWEP